MTPKERTALEERELEGYSNDELRRLDEIERDRARQQGEIPYQGYRRFLRQRISEAAREIRDGAHHEKS